MIETAPAPAPTTRRRAIDVLCWLAVTPGAGWAAVRLTGSERGPLVQAVAFTPYAAVGSLAVLVLTLALRRRAPAVVAAVVALALVGAVAPRVLPSAPPPATGPSLRLLTANLLFGGADARALVELVRRERVDVLTVQEFTPAAQAALDAAGLAGLLPHRQLGAAADSTGSGLYSRHPLSDGGVRRNPGVFHFSQAYATVAVPGAPPLRVESAHPCAPFSLQMVDDWFADQRAQPRATPDGPLRVLAGDFNATLDHAPLRDLLAGGYVDAADAVGAGLSGTWGPYDGDPIPPVTIDHVLVDRRIAVRAVDVRPVPGTDHRAVLAELRLPAG